MFGHGNADGAGRELGCDWVESMEAGTDAVDRTLVSGGHALRIEGDGGRADTVDVGPGDGVGKVGEVVSEASEGVAELDMLFEGGFGELDDLLEALRREVGGVGVEKLETRRVVDGVPSVEGLLREAFELGVEVLIGVGFGEG